MKRVEGASMEVEFKMIQRNLLELAEKVEVLNQEMDVKTPAQKQVIDATNEKLSALLRSMRELDYNLFYVNKLQNEWNEKKVGF